MSTIAHAASSVEHVGVRLRSAADRQRAEDRAHIARVVAAHPHYLDWLEDKLRAAAADAIEAEAAHMAKLGHHAMATALQERAVGYRRGDRKAW